MANPNNNGTLIGRLVEDPRVFDNNDGSHKVVATVAATNNFQSTRNGMRAFHPEYIPVERFYRADANMTLAGYRKGDMIALTFHLERQQYADKAKFIYELKAVVDNVWPLESRSARLTRQADRLKGENAQLAAAQSVQPQAQTQLSIRPVAPAVPVGNTYDEEEFYGEPPF